MTIPHAKSAPPDVRDKFALARTALASALIERDDEIDLVLTALIAGEHVLLVGPPGCGTSLLLDSVLKWTGGSKFTVLLTKFTTPEEVVGLVSLAALKEDKYLRVTAGNNRLSPVCCLREASRGGRASAGGCQSP